MLNRNEIVTFWSNKGETGIYSQWYQSPITIDGNVFCCNEQYMMYSKAVLFNDTRVAYEIMSTHDPREIKALGRMVKNFDEVIWNKHKEEIVYKANYAKFTQNEKLKEKLLATGTKELIEASPCDFVWGVGLAEDNDKILDKSSWPGLNLLGKAIMKVREEIKNEL